MKQKCSVSLIAGIIFGIVAIISLSNMRYGFSVWGLLWIIGYAAVAAVLIMKKRDNYAFIAFALLALLQLLSFFRGFGAGFYQTYRERFSLYKMTISLVSTIASIGMLCFPATNFIPQLQSYKEKINRLWFVPAILVGVEAVLDIFGIFVVGWIPNILTIILIAVAYALSAFWIVYPDGLPIKEKQKNSYNAGANYIVSTIKNEAYYDLVKHILLLIFTLGIWNYIWIYHMTGYTNEVKDEPYRDRTKQLLLCILVPFYSVYWTYQTAQRIDKMAAERGISFDMTNVCLVLAIFIGVAPPILLQYVMNKIVMASKNFA